MTFRAISIDDYINLVHFWKENYFVNEMDSMSRFALFLEKNPALSILAEDNGIIVGTALGSFDGRRGYLQKVVVDKAFRKKGLGKQLVVQVINKLRNLGAIYIPINIEEDLLHFYETCGFKKTTQVSMNMEIR